MSHIIPEHLKGIMIRTETRESGNLKFDPTCQCCKKVGNYPMAGWDVDETPFWICLECIEEVGFILHHYEKPEENEE